MSVLVEEPACDCCKSATQRREYITREGTGLVVCVDAKICITHAKALGRWMGRAR